MDLKEAHLTPEVTPSAAPEGAPAAVAPPTPAERSESPLPGVAARNWDRQIAPIKEGAAPAADAPQSDSSTVAAEAAASAVGTTGGGEAPAPAPAPPSKFVFGGVEFEDQTKAEHSFKTLRGMHAAKDRELQAYRLRTLELERDLARLKNPEAREEAPKPKGNGQAAAAQVPQGTPADTYAVFEVLKEKFGPKIANEWLEEQNDARVNARVEAKLAEALQEIKATIEPLRETHAQLEERAQLTGIFQQMATYTLPDGSPAYPELGDEKAMRDVGVLWKNMGGVVSDLKTPRGVHIAIAAYRDAMATRARVAPKTPKPAAPAARAAVDPGVVSAGGDSPARHPNQPGPAVDPNDVGERLLKADLKSDKNLGFRIRKF